MLAQLLAGRLAEEEAKKIAQMLAVDPGLRTAYQEQMAMHAMLKWRHGNAGRTELGEIDPIAMAELLAEASAASRRLAEEEYAAQAKRDAEEREKLEKARQKNRRRERPAHNLAYAGIATGIAAVAAGLMWVTLLLFPSGDFSDGGLGIASGGSASSLGFSPSPRVARIVDSIDVQLSILPGRANVGPEDLLAATVGTHLKSGHYVLATGVLQLHFDRGAKIILEAPGEIALESADRVRLIRGRLVGDVPPRAIGFTVQTPTATIVDLGTEFGVSVAGDEAVDVSVFDGEVEVVASPLAGLGPFGRQRLAAGNLTADNLAELTADNLAEGNSVRVDAGGDFVESETNPNLYFREVPEHETLQQKIAFERWLRHSEKIAADPSVVAYYTFCDQHSSDLVLYNRVANKLAANDLADQKASTSSHGDIVGAQWAEGRWPLKQSLRFGSEGLNDNPNSYVEVDISGQFEELTIAVWVNIDSLSGSGFSSLLMSSGWSRPGQLHWEIHKDRLHLGVFSAGNGREPESSTRLGSGAGQWQHVAFVYKEQQVDFYLDGQPAGTCPIDIVGDLLLGVSRIGNWDTGSGTARSRILHGRMDELLVARRVFSDTEIEELFRIGQP